MIEEFEQLRVAIHQAASERGLLVFNGEPNVSNFASVVWNADWLAFLDLAQRVHASLLYVCERRYEPGQIIAEESGDPDLIDDEIDNEEVTGSIEETEHESKVWLLERIRERIAPWDARRGEIISLSCIWIKDGVAHHWRHYAEWIFECREAIGAVLDEAEMTKQENRVLRSQEAARTLHKYATLMAQHPRFSEASSEEKREFMASQLFPEITTGDLRSYRPYRSIAQRAMLIYWWDIEPIEKITKAERAKALYAQGESIRNIAAVLKMSETKVKAAIADTQ
jgi:hypothetical protein